MKRSEMIDVIRGALIGELKDDSEFALYATSKYLLGQIEGAGMLPPNIYDFEDEEDILNSYCWEPEDEE